MNEDIKKNERCSESRILSLPLSWLVDTCVLEEEEKKNRMGGDLDMV